MSRQKNPFSGDLHGLVGWQGVVGWQGLVGCCSVTPFRLVRFEGRRWAFRSVDGRGCCSSCSDVLQLVCVVFGWVLGNQT